MEIKIPMSENVIRSKRDALRESTLPPNGYNKTNATIITLQFVGCKDSHVWRLCPDQGPWKKASHFTDIDKPQRQPKKLCTVQ